MTGHWSMILKRLSVMTCYVLCGGTWHSVPVPLHCFLRNPWRLLLGHSGQVTHTIGLSGPRMPTESTENYFQFVETTFSLTENNLCCFIQSILGTTKVNGHRPSMTQKHPPETHKMALCCGSVWWVVNHCLRNAALNGNMYELPRPCSGFYLRDTQLLFVLSNLTPL